MGNKEFEEGQGGSVSKESACKAGDPALIPALGRSLEKGMATHSSILAWRIPLTEEPGGLQSMGSQKVRHDWATKKSLCKGRTVSCHQREVEFGCRGKGSTCQGRLLPYGKDVTGWASRSCSSSNVLGRVVWKQPLDGGQVKWKQWVTAWLLLLGRLCLKDLISPQQHWIFWGGTSMMGKGEERKHVVTSVGFKHVQVLLAASGLQ